MRPQTTDVSQIAQNLISTKESFFRSPAQLNQNLTRSRVGGEDQMIMKKITLIFVSTLLFVSNQFAFAESAGSKAASSKQTTQMKKSKEALYSEITSTFGFVPTMFTLIPDASLEGAWMEFRDLQANANTAIPAKYKDLIGLAVAAQIPCQYCAYFHRQSAMNLQSASETETKEAIAIAALVRHWSTFLNGIDENKSEFDQDLKKIFPTGVQQRAPASTKGGAKGSMAKNAASMDALNSALTMAPQNAEETYKEIAQVWGFVPQFIKKFPKQGVAGAWAEVKTLELNPNTQIPSKYKALIGLAVSSQVPCDYCVSFDTAAAKSAGATNAELNEAIAMASITRHWSTVLNGSLVDEMLFQNETQKIINNLKQKSQSGSLRQPASVPESPSNDMPMEDSSEE